MKFKFDEDQWLKQAMLWIKSTYDEKYHYAGGIDTTEFCMSNFKTLEALQFNVIKYVLRYGRKNGSNDKDLFKAIHYALMMLHYKNKAGEEPTEPPTDTGQVAV